MSDAEKPVYIIVKGRLLETIENKVNAKIKEGYVPQCPLILSSGGEADYIQPMILKEFAKS
ncbi:hypothetical protein [Candidatus Albibeggiatoa sp. nov. NOAA]|uniref:hypothetical protein n=1 Tax=Candidatus Albibeggiatoa sp. nov. NOAA TaxID=3162724 RepID=UPI0032F0F42A|nr:hypothetical protein [Thiotrichaceae bacterium]